MLCPVLPCVATGRVWQCGYQLSGLRKAESRTLRAAYHAARVTSRSVLITGATGYLGRPLTTLAHRRGYHVRAFVRPGSEARVAPGAELIVGDAFSVDDLAAAMSPGDTLVHLLG